MIKINSVVRLYDYRFHAPSVCLSVCLSLSLSLFFFFFSFIHHREQKQKRRKTGSFQVRLIKPCGKGEVSFPPTPLVAFFPSLSRIFSLPAAGNFFFGFVAKIALANSVDFFFSDFTHFRPPFLAASFA